MTDLLQELDECGALGIGSMGLSPIAVVGPGRFAPTRDFKTRLHMICPDDPEHPSDAVAFNRWHPGQWWTRTGFSPVMGWRDIEYAALDRVPLLICATPLSWLRARRSRPAVCIADWRFNPRRHLDDIGVPVECETPEVEQRLRKRIADCEHARFTIQTTTGLQRPTEMHCAA